MKRLITAAFLVSAFFTASETFAQEQETESESNGMMVIRSSDGDGNTFENVQVMSVDSSDGGSYFMSSGLGGAMMGGDQFGMLNNASVQKDLELVGDQLSRIKEINKDFGKQIREQMGSFNSADGKLDMDRIKGLGEMIRELKSQQKEEINNILLPHQQDRLKQVSLQMQMKNMGTAKALTNKLAEELGLTDEQKKELKKRSKEVQEEIKKKTEQLKADGRESLLKILTSQQRKQLENMIGNKFESPVDDQMSDFRRRFNSRRAPRQKKVDSDK